MALGLLWQFKLPRWTLWNLESPPTSHQRPWLCSLYPFQTKVRGCYRTSYYTYTPYPLLDGPRLRDGRKVASGHQHGPMRGEATALSSGVPVLEDEAGEGEGAQHGRCDPIIHGTLSCLLELQTGTGGLGTSGLPLLALWLSLLGVW